MDATNYTNSCRESELSGSPERKISIDGSVRALKSALPKVTRKTLAGDLWQQAIIKPIGLRTPL
jgi:hypothetical protein